MAIAPNGVAVAAAAANGVAGCRCCLELVALDPRKKIAFKLAEKIELRFTACACFRFATSDHQRHKVEPSSGWGEVLCFFL